MNLLYLGYWGIDEGLTASTIFPHLEILSQNESIEKIIFCTIERNTGFSTKLSIPKVIHRPLKSKGLKPEFLNKILDFIFFPKKLVQLCKQNKIDYIIARAAPAGALAYKVYQKLNIPYAVESFEPHADYMLESGVWSENNPKYVFQKKWEEKIKQTAENLVPVAHNYKKQLISEGLKEKNIYVIPCCVETSNFKFDVIKRNQIRGELNISKDTVVGVYVGKFGGIYYDKESFKIFKKAFQKFNKNFFLILLTPEKKSQVEKRLKEVDFPIENTHITLSPHHKVPEYLSASDFAFSTIKPAPSRIYCSAIKNGEYWANGLPILMTEGVGDDTEIIENENAGAIFNLEKKNVDAAIEKIKHLLEVESRQKLAERIVKVALKHRNFEITHKVYQSILKKYTFASTENQ